MSRKTGNPTRSDTDRAGGRRRAGSNFEPTGIDIEKLMEARKLMVAALPEEPVYGHMALAGLPKGFRAAA